MIESDCIGTRAKENQLVLALPTGMSVILTAYFELLAVEEGIDNRLTWVLCMRLEQIT
jgi:hypothetical protein